MATDSVDGQHVVVPCKFSFRQFREYMIQNVGLDPGVDCQQFFEEYSGHRSKNCGKDAWRCMGHQPHMIPIFSFPNPSTLGQSAHMPMGIMAPTAGRFLGPRPLFPEAAAFAPLQQHNARGPNAVLNVPAQDNRSLSPHAAEFLPGQVVGDVARDDLQAIAVLDIVTATRQHIGPHTQRRDRAAASDPYLPVTFEDNSGSDNIRNGDTNGDTKNGYASNGYTSNGHTGDGDIGDGVIGNEYIGNGDNSNKYTSDGYIINEYVNNGDASNGVTGNRHINIGHTRNEDTSNRRTRNRNTYRGITFLNGRLPTIAADEVSPDSWNITFGLEDDGLLDPAVYARQAPGTWRHVGHSVIRPEMVELLDGTTALTTPPHGRLGAIGSEILGTA